MKTKAQKKAHAEAQARYKESRIALGLTPKLYWGNEHFHADAKVLERRHLKLRDKS